MGALEGKIQWKIFFFCICKINTQKFLDFGQLAFEKGLEKGSFDSLLWPMLIIRTRPWRRNDLSLTWNIVLCLTWFSASTKCRTDSLNIGPLRLSEYWQEGDTYFFLLMNCTPLLHASVCQTTSIAWRTHQLAWSHPCTSARLPQHLLLFDWWRNRSVYPRWRSLFISPCCSATVGRPWQKGLRATLRH